MNPRQWPCASFVSRLQSSFTRPLKSPRTYTAFALGAQTRNVAPSAIRFAPIGVPDEMWSRGAGMNSPGGKGRMSQADAGGLSPADDTDATTFGRSTADSSRADIEIMICKSDHNTI